VKKEKPPVKVGRAFRRDMLKAADELAKFAARCLCLKTRRRIYEAANFARRSYGFSDEQHADIVLMHILDGCQTVDDIEDEANLSADAIERALKTLFEQKRIKRTRSGKSRGRALYLYDAVED